MRNVFWASNRDFENKRFWEWGVGVCGDAVLFDFRCVFARTYFKLRYYGFTKLLQKISGNFNEVCCFLILLCAVFVRISVRFSAESHAPLTPLTHPSFELKVYLTITLRFTAIQTIYSLQTYCGIKAVFQRNSNNLHKQLYQSCFRFSLTFFFSFFCKTWTDNWSGQRVVCNVQFVIAKKIQLKIISFNKCHKQPFCSFLAEFN